MAERIAIFCSGWTGAGFAAAVDLCFLAMLGLVIAREIVVGKSTHILRCSRLPHWCSREMRCSISSQSPVLAMGTETRLGIAAAILLIMLIGGRIIPSFTRNWLVRFGSGRLPTPFGRLDAVAMVASALALAGWVIAPLAASTSILAIVAAGLNVVRLGRWAGYRTATEPLVLILPVATRSFRSAFSFSASQFSPALSHRPVRRTLGPRALSGS